MRARPPAAVELRANAQQAFGRLAQPASPFAVRTGIMKATGWEDQPGGIRCAPRSEAGRHSGCARRRRLVRKGGLEPPWVAPPDPESGEVIQNPIDWRGFDAHPKFLVTDLVTTPKCKPPAGGGHEPLRCRAIRCSLVRKGGLEPPRVAPPGPKPGASANFATLAHHLASPSISGPFSTNGRSPI
jgi:hypothetical protein